MDPSLQQFIQHETEKQKLQVCFLRLKYWQLLTRPNVTLLDATYILKCL